MQKITGNKKYYDYTNEVQFVKSLRNEPTSKSQSNTVSSKLIIDNADKRHDSSSERIIYSGKHDTWSNSDEDSNIIDKLKELVSFREYGTWSSSDEDINDNLDNR